MPPPFSEDDFKKIICAYKKIFPEQPSDDLKKYFNFERKQQGREWSYICSNFYEIATRPDYYESIKKYDEELRKLIGELKKSNDTADEIANKIKKLINGNTDYKHFGSAIGISTYTDELLLRSKNENEDELPKEIVVVLAHDWYPIVSLNTEINFIPPLKGYSIFEGEGKNGNKIERVYGKMIKLIPSKKYTILFLNLFPDYREPGALPRGQIKDVNYEFFADGIINLIKSIGSKFTVKCILTWGCIPFDCIKKFCVPVEKIELSAIIKNKIALILKINEKEIPLIPLYHPSSGGRGYYNQEHQTYLNDIIKNILDGIES